MGLSKEEKAQLDALSKKAEEPDGPPDNMSFTLDLSSDSAWERAKHLGLVRDPEPAGNGDEGNDEGGEGDDPPKRRSGANRWAAGGS